MRKEVKTGFTALIKKKGKEAYEKVDSRYIGRNVIDEFLRIQLFDAK